MSNSAQLKLGLHDKNSIFKRYLQIHAIGFSFPSCVSMSKSERLCEANIFYPLPTEDSLWFLHIGKGQTLREMTFAKRGNAKPLGKQLMTELLERYCHITVFAVIIICFHYLILIKLYTMSKAWNWPIH